MFFLVFFSVSLPHLCGPDWANPAVLVQSQGNKLVRVEINNEISEKPQWKIARHHEASESLLRKRKSLRNRDITRLSRSLPCCQRHTRQPYRRTYSLYLYTIFSRSSPLPHLVVELDKKSSWCQSPVNFFSVRVTHRYFSLGRAPRLVYDSEPLLHPHRSTHYRHADPKLHFPYKEPTSAHRHDGFFSLAFLV